MRCSDPIETCAVVIAYKDAQDFERVAVALAPQVELLIVVSNSCPREYLVQILDRLPCAALLHYHALNMGVATALNCGLALARSAGYSWVLLSDQDSMPSPTLVADLHAVYRRATARGLRVGLVGPNWADAGTGKTAYSTHTSHGLGWHAVPSLIMSGTLLSMDAHTDIGPFPGSWFIDSVDTEYCFRARLGGWEVLVSGEVLMGHEIGARVGKTMPWRSYYLARNALWLVGRHGWALPGPSVRILCHWARFVVGTLRHTGPTAKARYWMWRGVRDGLHPNAPRWDPFPNIASDALNDDHAINYTTARGR